MSEIPGLLQTKFSGRKIRYIEGNCDKWQTYASEAYNMLITSFTPLSRKGERQDKDKYSHLDVSIMWCAGMNPFR